MADDNTNDNLGFDRTIKGLRDLSAEIQYAVDAQDIASRKLARSVDNVFNSMVNSYADISKNEEKIKEDLLTQVNITKQIVNAKARHANLSQQINELQERGLLSSRDTKIAQDELSKYSSNFIGSLKQQESQIGGIWGEVRRGIKTAVPGAKQLTQLMGNKVGLAAVVAIAVESLIKANGQIAEIRRNMGVSAVEALKFRGHISAAAASSNSLRVNSEALLETNQSLNDALGTSLAFDQDTLVTNTKLLDAKVLTAEAASNLASNARVHGESTSQALALQENIVNSVNKEHGVRLSLKGVLEATNKITGQIRAQLAANPEAIAHAVTKAKALGVELSEIAGIGKSMLDFESSISAELEAQVLTGKQLNFGQARLAALTGDYATLAEEITNQVGDFYEFSKLNVIQQDAVAKAAGMTSDSLSDMLFKQADFNTLLEEARATGDQQKVDSLLALSAQEKFGKLITKLKSSFVDVMVALSPIVDLLAFALDLVGYIAQGISSVASVLTPALGGISAATSGGGSQQAQAKEIDYDKMAQAMSRAQINTSINYDTFAATNVNATNGTYRNDIRYEHSLA